MRRLQAVLNRIHPLDGRFLERAQQKIDSLTKPRGSLGRLEECARRYAAIREDLAPAVNRKVIFTFAGDHGIVEEGVSAYPGQVTVQMVLNMLAGGAGVNALARHVGAEVAVVDIGVNHDFVPPGNLIVRKVGYGTRNFTKGPAMTRDEALRSIRVGIDLADEYAKKGMDIAGTGEMGIGNTTPSSAILAVLGGIEPEAVTGRGTGIDDRTLGVKTSVIERAIAVNRPDPGDPLDVLARVGGFEIGGITGLIIGCAARRIPVVVDGFISTAGALIATRMSPVINEYLFYSHLSAEAGHRQMLEAIGGRPILDLDMKLGEGTGAALTMSVIEASVKVMNEMATFASAGVDTETV